MGRKPKNHTLGVWMNGEHVGRWTVKFNRSHEFEYAETWLSSQYRRSISLSMPLSTVGMIYKGNLVESYFDNLLPDNNQIRERIQQRFNASSKGAFDLLTEIGRDCVGALQLMPDDTAPSPHKRIEAEELSEDEIENILRRTPVIGQQQDEDDFRISLAGAQEKTALLFHQGKWMRPRGATPTTHILKLPIGRHSDLNVDLSTSVENEWLCAQILTAYGIDTAKCWPQIFGSQKVLVVERFDRQLSSDAKWYMRLPQEDMCQAKGISSDLKYESNGGPGIKSIMDLLLGSDNAEADRRIFFKTQIIFWLLCAIDGHAKNFSIFHKPGGSYSLTPLYDILSGYPILGNGAGHLSEKKAKMAMALTGNNRHYKWIDLQRRYLVETAKSCGFDQPGEEVINEVIAETPHVIQKTAQALPGDFPATIAEPILKGLERAAASIAQ